MGLSNSTRWFHAITATATLLAALACGGRGGSPQTPQPVIKQTEAYLGWTGSPENAESPYAYSLVRVNGTTGAVTKIGDAWNYLTGLAYGTDGTLYGVSTELLRVDPVGGTLTRIGSLDYGSEKGILMMSIAMSPSGQLFALECGGKRRLFTVNLATGALTLVGTPTESVLGLGCSSNGSLYGSFANLFTLDPTNGTTRSKVGSLGANVGWIAIDGQDQCEGMDRFPSTTAFRVNLSGGTATPTVKLQAKNLTCLVAERAKPASTLPPAPVTSTVAPVDEATLRSLVERTRSEHRLIRAQFQGAR